jgi:hypothetical protein
MYKGLTKEQRLVSQPLIVGRKQIQFPKRRVPWYCLNYGMIDKVKELSNSDLLCAVRTPYGLLTLRESFGPVFITHIIMTCGEDRNMCGGKSLNFTLHFLSKGESRRCERCVNLSRYCHECDHC